MEQTQTDKLFIEIRVKNERIKELESALIKMKRDFDSLKDICDKLLFKAEKEPVLTFDRESGELIKMD